jgi:hypothetical protein
LSPIVFPGLTTTFQKYFFKQEFLHCLSCQLRLSSSKVASRLDASLRWHDNEKTFWTAVGSNPERQLAAHAEFYSSGLSPK